MSRKRGENAVPYGGGKRPTLALATSPDILWYHCSSLKSAIVGNKGKRRGGKGTHSRDQFGLLKELPKEGRPQYRIAVGGRRRRPTRSCAW